MPDEKNPVERFFDRMLGVGEFSDARDDDPETFTETPTESLGPIAHDLDAQKRRSIIYRLPSHLKSQAEAANKQYKDNQTFLNAITNILREDQIYESDLDPDSRRVAHPWPEPGDNNYDPTDIKNPNYDPEYDPDLY